MSYTNKYQKDVAAVIDVNQYVLMISLVSLSKHTQVKMLFTILLIEGSKCCSDVMKKHLNKEHVMTKEDKISTKCWICDNN